MPLVLADDERIARLKRQLEETARRAAATELRIKAASRLPWDDDPPAQPLEPVAISAITAPGFSPASAPLLAARRTTRR